MTDAQKAVIISLPAAISSQGSKPQACPPAPLSRRQEAQVSETCSTCRFFVKHEAEHVYGDCHRYPATFNFHANISDPSEWRSTRFRIDVTRERNAVWSNIHQDEFCGEHQHKEGGHG